MASFDLQSMSQRWARFLAAAQLRDPGNRLFDELVKAYTDSSRHYHDLNHIQHCLQMLDQVRNIRPDILAVEAAIWFHDVVYDATRNDNEEQSARIARRRLTQIGAQPRMIEQVDRLIMDTLHQQKPATVAGQFLVDIDLVTLGVPFVEFESYGRHIREEFSHLDDATYFAGRIAFFKSILDRPTIYYTDFFRSRYESAARINMERALQNLHT